MKGYEIFSRVPSESNAMATECKYFSFIKDVKTMTIVLLELNGDSKGYCPFYGNSYGKIESYASHLVRREQGQRVSSLHVLCCLMNN